jgi:hypothetical protein
MSPQRALLAALTAFALSAGQAGAAEPTLVPPTVIDPASGTRVPAGTHVNFSVRTFADDSMLWVHISQSPATDECGVVGSDVRTYSLDPTSEPDVYRTDTTLYTFDGFWMVTPGTYYWQAYRIEHHFEADGCIETPVQTLVITEGGGETRPVVRPNVNVTAGKSIAVKFDFPNPANVTTTLKKGTKTITTVTKATQPGTVKVPVPTQANKYCPLWRVGRAAAAQGCPLPAGNYKLTTNVVSKTTGEKYTVNQAVKVAAPPEKKPVVPQRVTIKQGKPIAVKFNFPSPAKVTTTLKQGAKTVATVKKTVKPGTVKVTVPAKSPSYCPLARPAAASCPLPKGNYKVTTKLVSKKTSKKYQVSQAVKVTSIRG